VAKRYARMITDADRLTRPTAVFCYNDNIAVNLINEFREFGILIPQDISIIGFDEATIASQSYPLLTKISHPKYDMGTKAAEIILTSIRKEPLTTLTYQFELSLVIRSSVQKLDV
jgi:GntR family transcriptional regulator of arabinose operon